MVKMTSVKAFGCPK